MYIYTIHVFICIYLYYINVSHVTLRVTFKRWCFGLLSHFCIFFIPEKLNVIAQSVHWWASFTSKAWPMSMLLIAQSWTLQNKEAISFSAKPLLQGWVRRFSSQPLASRHHSWKIPSSILPMHSSRVKSSAVTASRTHSLCFNLNLILLLLIYFRWSLHSALRGPI